ncbi:helix-turn-helix domain-containing protein [Streptomyces sp. NPDC051920]|uniref:PucR family transcriptional regulator n=1 Tax=Streptomyces sp. NPDC051920 TaxID=3155523 RepID=UPI003440471F
MRPPQTAPAADHLRHAAAALSGPLIEVLLVPPDARRALSSVVIAEPYDEPRPYDEALVLLIGARGEAALRGLIAAGRGGATAVAVRTGADPEAVEVLRRAAAELGLALLGVSDDARWEQVEAVARTVVDAVRQAPDVAEEAADGDLFSLAQTLATLTGGVVSVEDAANRVLAYSRSGDRADEVRRLSILGHACPDAYLAVLREAGVYARLRAGEEVVEVAERPDLGARRRFVAGIRAGDRLLGTVWIQEGPQALDGRTAELLLGASRLATLLLIRHPVRPGRDGGLREELAAGLLEERVPPGALAGRLGIGPDCRTTVLGIDLRQTVGADGPALELGRARAAGIVAVHAAAYRRTAVTTQSDGRLYVLVPDPAAGPGHTAPPRPGASPGHLADAKLLTWTVELVTTLRRHLGSPVQAAIAQPAPRLGDAPTARRSADRILRVMGRDPERTVATYAQVRAAVVLDEILGLLAESPTVHDPALRRLAEHDRRNGTELCESLLRYLDAFGEVKEVAAGLHIHPNTLRHRIRRAAQLSGVDLADPDQRLVALLELRRMRAPARLP